MTNGSVPNQVCYTALALSNYRLLHVIIAIKILTCFSGILFTSLHSKKQGIAWLVHPNSKVIYVLHIFLAIYVPATYSIAFSIDLIRFLIPYSDPCDYTIPATWGIILRALPVFGLVAQTFTMSSFAIERLIATFAAVDYERVKSPKLGVALGIFAPCAACIVVYTLILNPIDWNNRLPMTALRTAENADSYQLFLSLLMYVEITTISIFALSFLINYTSKRRATSRTFTLSSKYQMNENKHLIITLLPCFIVHFLLNLIPVIGLKLYFLFFHYEQGAYAAWAELWTQAQMYSLVTPIIIHLRLKLHRSQEITDVHSTTTHFQQLQVMFNKKY